MSTILAGLVACLMLQSGSPVNLAKIESQYHANEAAKLGFLFRYNIYKSSGRPDPVVWLSSFKNADHMICRYYEDDDQIFFVGDVSSRKSKNVSKTISGNVAKMNVALDHTSAIYNKPELLQYTRLETMAHIQMKKTPKLHIPEPTPMTFGIFADNEHAIDGLLRKARKGEVTVNAAQKGSTVTLNFVNKLTGYTVDITTDEEKNYVPLQVIVYETGKDPKESSTRAFFSGYTLHQSAFYYPSLVHSQLIQKGNIVFCTTNELSSLTKPALSELKDQLDKQRSINVDGMLYSNMNNTQKQIGYEDLPRLYQQCEELSQRTLAAKAPKTTSSRMPYVLTAAGLMLVLLVYLYIRRTRKMSLMSTT